MTLHLLFTEPMYWVWNLKDIHFLRSHVVAPVAEEFVFRACMLPLLLQCFRPLTAIFIAPLFFGVGKYSLPIILCLSSYSMEWNVCIHLYLYFFSSSPPHVR